MSPSCTEQDRKRSRHGCRKVFRCWEKTNKQINTYTSSLFCIKIFTPCWRSCAFFFLMLKRKRYQHMLKYTSSMSSALNDNLRWVTTRWHHMTCQRCVIEVPFFLSFNNLSGFVDFVLIPALVNKHGRGLSILENRRVHGESGGQRQRRLLQGAAPQRAALRTHRHRLGFWTRRTVEGALNVNCKKALGSKQGGQSLHLCTYLPRCAQACGCWLPVSCCVSCPGWLTSALR